MLHETTVLRAMRPIPSPAGHLSTALRHALIRLLFGAWITTLLTTQVLAQMAPIQAPLGKGVLLVSHPAMEDPNFRHTVVLIVEHGPEGTMGFILNRPTDILLSQTLPDIVALKGTSHRLFLGGPVVPNRMTMLVRLSTPVPDVTPIIDNLYIGGTPQMLDDLLSHPKPNEAFRVFAGMAGWAPGQLDFELRQEAWATLPADAEGIFDEDPASLWPDSLKRLQAPMVISTEHAPLQHTREGLGHQIETISAY